MICFQLHVMFIFIVIKKIFKQARQCYKVLYMKRLKRLIVKMADMISFSGCYFTFEALQIK